MTIVAIGVQPVMGQASSTIGRRSYVVTYTVDGVESGPSNEVSCSNNLNLRMNMNVVHWDADGQVGTFSVYCSDGGTLGWIGSTAKLRFFDEGINPDTARRPPQNGAT